MTTVFTVGHSRHSAEHFMAILRSHAIERLVDVRSQPYSKWAPHFDKTALEGFLGVHGIEYVFLGRQLGGRPEDRAYYRDDGTVDYALRAAAADFRVGIEQLSLFSHGRRTTIMCAEEDPTRCHRRLLVAPALALLDLAVVHVRGDGRLEPEPDLAPISTRQLDLFGGPS
jgi:uncharacterized protein (DUF488 family)